MNKFVLTTDKQAWGTESVLTPLFSIHLEKKNLIGHCIPQK